MNTPHWLWEELQEFWKARSLIQKMKSKAPEPSNTKDLVRLAQQQGFDVDPAWLTEDADGA